MIFSFFKSKPERAHAASLYREAVEQARKPFFYRDWQVPDTFEGRFELVTLHVFMILHRLKQDEGRDSEAKAALSQALFDVMFQNMDDTLREMGVGDLSVARKVRAMAEAFYGRCGSYEEALGKSNTDKLISAISRNVYGVEVSGEPEDISSAYFAGTLVDYINKVLSELSQIPASRLMSGIINFPSPESTG